MTRAYIERSTKGGAYNENEQSACAHEVESYGAQGLAPGCAPDE